ncbi:Na(+)/H(+) antiporter subunit B [Halalkalibacillus sediminis]|uniref:Na(+)/H(+) antiporter subunit B n=1 Tax=Halalkalibacillus sediminis TaxID=2018042 RepID=A0A2I0QWJ2_9BACI|nr:Na(+)/H(+) antiporter subunit B [Halalkalibacillus sediminis]PKR78713.1 Na(+)/H(+) antiporter subunit B [Halalkalibacillus sediminis]
MKRTNDLILRTTTQLIAFILLGFSVYLFFAGHNNPGGGFIGGLMTAAAFILMYMTYGYERITRILPLNFRLVFVTGLLIATLSGVGAIFFDQQFLSQADGYFQLPIFGEKHLATAVLFDLGVYLAVVGVTMTIILSIATDQKSDEVEESGV